MINQERDMRNQIKKMEDDLLRSKDFQKQLEIHNELMGYRKKLQEIIYKNMRSISN